MSGLINSFVFAPAGGGGDSGPELISGLQLWLNANAIVGASDGDQISTWADQSSNGRDATGVVANTLKPTYRATDGPNSKPAIRFADTGTGQGGYFTLPDFLSASGWTAGHGLVVVKIDNDPPADALHGGPPFGEWGSNTDEYFPYFGDSGIYDGFGSSARKTTGDPASALTSWRLYEARTASGAWSNRIDGSVHFSTATNTVAWGSAPKIGRSTTNAKVLFGLIAEVIFYNAVLGTTDYNSLKSYLNTKYGFSL